MLAPKNSPLDISKQWSVYEYSIKNELARKRWGSIRNGVYQSALINDETPISAEALDILAFTTREANPYVREKTIIETKWQILDTFDAQYQFRLENVVVYGWKLQLYHTYYNLTEARGKSQWNTLTDELAEQSGFAISAINGGF